MKMKSNHTNSGFTLIEIMIVVAIIGILAAIVIPNMTKNLDTTRQRRVRDQSAEYRWRQAAVGSGASPTTHGRADR